MSFPNGNEVTILPSSMQDWLFAVVLEHWFEMISSFFEIDYLI